MEIVIINEEELITITLGNNIKKGEVPQAMIPANAWFAAKLKEASGYSLVSCTVSPGFDFLDFELAKRESLLQQHPHLKDVIERFS